MQKTLVHWQNAMGKWVIAGPVRDAVWVKALLESTHLLAMGMILFAIGMICLRLTGLGARSGSASEMMRRFIPWVWGALAVVFLTGVILTTGAGRARGMTTPMFQLKMLLMLAAIVTTGALQFTVSRDRSFWERGSARRLSTSVIAPLCLLLWLATVFAGRWLAYGYILFPNAGTGYNTGFSAF